MFGRKKKKQEFSKDGSEIFRHKNPKNDEWQPPAESLYIEEITAHFDKCFPNRESSVLHEILSDLVHIDVHIMNPSPDEDFWVVFTTGMSDLPMTIPEGIDNPEEWSRAELVMFLPAEWNPQNATDASEKTPHNDFIPISTLKYLARMPHYFKTWLGSGHTIPNGPDYEPFVEGSQMAGVVLLELDEKSSYMTAADGTVINFYLVVPLSKAETEYKLENGMDALVQKMIEHEVGTDFDMNRECVL